MIFYLYSHLSTTGRSTVLRSLGGNLGNAFHLASCSGVQTLPSKYIFSKFALCSRLSLSIGAFKMIKKIIYYFLLFVLFTVVVNATLDRFQQVIVNTPIYKFLVWAYSWWGYFNYKPPIVVPPKPIVTQIYDEDAVLKGMKSFWDSNHAMRSGQNQIQLFGHQLRDTIAIGNDKLTDSASKDWKSVVIDAIPLAKSYLSVASSLEEGISLNS